MLPDYIYLLLDIALLPILERVLYSAIASYLVAKHPSFTSVMTQHFTGSPDSRSVCHGLAGFVPTTMAPVYADHPFRFVTTPSSQLPEGTEVRMP